MTHADHAAGWCHHGATLALIRALEDERALHPVTGWDGALYLATSRADCRELSAMYRHAALTGREAPK
jgi:hypothetical protein